jgi:hypothetical protein
MDVPTLVFVLAKNGDTESSAQEYALVWCKIRFSCHGLSYVLKVLLQIFWILNTVPDWHFQMKKIHNRHFF